MSLADVPIQWCPLSEGGEGGPCIVKSNSSWAMGTLGPPPPNEQTDWQTFKRLRFCLPVPKIITFRKIDVTRLCFHRHLWFCSQGACMARGCVAGGHAWQGGGMVGGMHGRRDGNCNGRYASYCNAFLFTCILTHLFTGLTVWLSLRSIVPCRFVDALITVRLRIHSSEGPRSNKNATFNVFPFHDVNPCVTYFTFLVAMVTNITKVTTNKTGRVYCLQYILSVVTV